MTTDHLRDHRAAKRAVGISNTKTAASMTDPTSTSWRLSSPAVWKRYSGAMVKTSAETNAAVATMVRNTRSGRAMTVSDRTTQGWRDQSRAVMAGDCTSECLVASEGL